MNFELIKFYEKYDTFILYRMYYCEKYLQKKGDAVRSAIFDLLTDRHYQILEEMYF